MNQDDSILQKIRIFVCFHASHKSINGTNSEKVGLPLQSLHIHVVKQDWTKKKNELTLSTSFYTLNNPTFNF